MKITRRKITAAVTPWKTRYEVHWVSPDGNDCLLGGSNSFDGAQKIALNQAQEIFESPFETDERKFHFLDNLYIWDMEADQEAMSYETEEQIDNLMSEIDSRIKKVTASDDYDDWEDDPRSDAEIVQDAEYDEDLLDIETEVLDELGLYADFSSVRGDYGPIWFFSDPNHENNSDMWMGDLDDALKEIDYSDYCNGLVTDVIMQPKDQWKDCYKKYIIDLVGEENVTAATESC